MTDSSYDLKPHKIAIIGSGKVGTTFAYALLLSGQVGEIVLIDVDKQRTEGEVMDLGDAVPLTHPTRILQGDYPDCAGADVVVITAGASQKPGETRLDLLKRNTAIFAGIIPQILRHNPQPLILNATNPVDILSYAAWKLSGLPAQRVIGSGTILDTARFRAALSQRFNLDARSVHAYIIGEHGDSEVAVWSSANIAGIPLVDYCQEVKGEVCEEDRARISEQVRNCRLRDHLAQGRHLLRRGGGSAAHRGKHPARPALRSFRIQPRPGLLRHRGCLSQPALGGGTHRRGAYIAHHPG